MTISFDDAGVKDSLYPFTVTRNAADIRIGILTIREKWQYLFSNRFAGLPKEAVVLPANIIPTKNTASSILSGAEDMSEKRITVPWDIFQLNDWALREDFDMITSGRQSQAISSTNSITCAENIFLEEGAKMEHCIINASTGPVYIGKNAEVMEGTVIRGPFALCEAAVLKLGTKVYGATTIGPYCAAGGEIKNSILFAYSNKAHDGYLGDSVLGEWCNLGAGTTNSNLKNTAGPVKVWNKAKKDFVPAGLKCGLLMGDYSRAAINTSFNTGTVVGVSCNIFGEGFPQKLVPDFTWGNEKYIFDKALQDISNWKKLKGHTLSENEIEILKSLYYQ
ncbi:MAG: putative sugar nucleotidyl transferase [Ferruginibacter sp.]